MTDRFLFLQLISKLMDEELMTCSFDCPPPLDREFWDRMTNCMQTEDHKTLEHIAAILRSGKSDFFCVENIRCLLTARGFDVGDCHDY